MTTPSSCFAGERRVHIALAVADVERSKRFYRTLFGVDPVKERDRYAKFEPADPSLNLALIEVAGATTRTPAASHFGIQVKTQEAVVTATDRLAAAGLDTLVEDQTTCCYAVQDKVWVTDPDGHRWEIFVVLDDAGARAETEAACCDGSTCCETAGAVAGGAVDAGATTGACCSA